MCPRHTAELLGGSCAPSRLTTSTLMTGKRRYIPCGSPLEDDQAVRRCLLTISAFCSRLRGVWSSCSLPCSAPSAPFRCHPMWCWRDTRVRALIRLCGQVLCTLSVVLVLACLPACSTGNSMLFVSPEETQQIYSSWETASGISVFGILGSTTETCDIVAFHVFHCFLR